MVLRFQLPEAVEETEDIRNVRDFLFFWLFFLFNLSIHCQRYRNLLAVLAMA